MENHAREQYKLDTSCRGITYLGIKVNRTLSLESTFKPIKSATMHIIHSLNPFLSSASVDLRVNIWKTFVKPMIEMGAIPFFFSQKVTEQEKVRNFIKKSIKLCLQFPSKGENKYLELINPYQWKERCEFICKRSECKWRMHKDKVTLKLPKDQMNHIDIKYLPGNFITLIKLFGSKCKYCETFRMSPQHLREVHQVPIRAFTIESTLSSWRNWKKE